MTASNAENYYGWRRGGGDASLRGSRPGQRSDNVWSRNGRLGRKDGNAWRRSGDHQLLSTPNGEQNKEI